MKLKKNILVYGLILLIYFLESPCAYSQSFETAVRSKLSREDQRKYIRYDKLVAKASAIAGDNPFMPDTTSKKENSFYVPQNHEISAYYLTQLDASLNLKYAIELKYEILGSNLKASWKRFKGDPKNVEWLSKAQSSSFDSLVKADNIRQQADLKLRIANKLPMLKVAEKLELAAELEMEKILFVLQNYPVNISPEWLATADTMNPLLIRPEGKNISLIRPLSESQLNAGPLKDTSLYSLLHITEQQVDLFNDFLLQKFPSQVENYVINFSRMSPARIDTLQDEWNNFELSDYVTHDSTFSNAIARPNSPIKTLAQVTKDAKSKRLQITRFKSGKSNISASPIEASALNNTDSISPPDFFYRVQIAASRTKLSQNEMKRKWEHPEKVIVVFEDHWYKYTIGSFSDYISARNSRIQSKVKDAFVVAYFNGRRIKITPYLVRKNHP